MVNITTDMWEKEILETCELKQTLSQCCLKSRFCTKTNSCWWSNWYKILITNYHRYFSQMSCHEYYHKVLHYKYATNIVWDKYLLSSILSDLK